MSGASTANWQVASTRLTRMWVTRPDAVTGRPAERPYALAVAHSVTDAVRQAAISRGIRPGLARRITYRTTAMAASPMIAAMTAAEGLSGCPGQKSTHSAIAGSSALRAAWAHQPIRRGPQAQASSAVMTRPRPMMVPSTMKNRCRYTVRVSSSSRPTKASPGNSAPTQPTERSRRIAPTGSNRDSSRSWMRASPNAQPKNPAASTRKTVWYQPGRL
jgi:hypothetical protein